MKKKLLFLLLLCAPIFVCAQDLINNKAELTVEEANTNYFLAVKARNLSVMLTYVTDSDEIPFVMGDGQLKKTKQEYIDFHKTWFADKNWDMDFEVLNIAKNKIQTIVTGKTRYFADRTNKEKEDNLIVTMIYTKIDGMWKVTGDICSAIK